MAIYHLNIQIISRGKGKSAVAAAAYRSSGKLTNEYDGVTHDYTRKGGVAYSEIMLPEHAPKEFFDRSTLWNDVEKIEKPKNSQLAREINVALPAELSLDQQKELTRAYCQKHFVDAGMCVDFNIHDKKDGNPHAHIMLTMRPLKADGKWDVKLKKEYLRDENGDRIFVAEHGYYKSRPAYTTDWNDKGKAEEWRAGWADITNDFLQRFGVAERIDHRSYERQSIDQIPTVHVGPAASKMERRGIITDRGDINRKAKADNLLLKQLRARINKLKTWLDKEEALHASGPVSASGGNLVQLLNDALINKENKGDWQQANNLKAISKAVAFLQSNNIATVPQLKEKVDEMRSRYDDTSGKIKKAERRLKMLDEHIKQADLYAKHNAIYKQYRQEKPGKQDAFYQNHADKIILFESAERYLKQHLNGHTTIPLKTWKAEAAALKIEKDQLYQNLNETKEDVQGVEIIKRNIEKILIPEDTKKAPVRTGKER